MIVSGMTELNGAMSGNIGDQTNQKSPVIETILDLSSGVLSGKRLVFSKADFFMQMYV